MSKTVVVNVCWSDGSLSVFDGVDLEYRGSFVVLFGEENKRKTWIRVAAARYYTVREEGESSE